MATATAALKVLGINDDVTTCGCCGRDDLKSTVVLGDGEGNVFGHYGSRCAAKALGFSAKQVGREVTRARKDQAERAERAERERAVAHAARWAVYDAWKVATYGDSANNLERSRRYRAEGGAL